MKRIIENDFLHVEIDDHGAELCSIYDKEKQREILWQADPAYWKRHAPILFPNVGRHYKDHYRVNGTEYPSRQHGFARDMDFACTDSSETSVTHLLESSNATEESYPFAFCLSVCHELKDRELTVHWRVENKASEDMFFTIGGHPAFNVPIEEGTEQKDYRLTFDKDESLDFYYIDPDSGTAQTDTLYRLTLEHRSCPIGSHMFDKDALLFDGYQIQQAGISLPDGSPYVQLTCESFPCFGIWSVPGAPFICLEPWMGRCDDCGFEKELSAKKNINGLKPSEIFEKSYSIQVF